MNIHMKFRKIYTDCAQILKKIVNKKTTLKTEIFKSKKPVSYIPIIEKVLQNYDVLTKVIKETNFEKKDLYYSLILCNEVLIGKINNQFWKNKFDVALNGHVLTHVKKTKYIRINTLKGNIEDVKDLHVEKTDIENVYKLIESADLSLNEAYKNGKFVVQNIASCIPAFILNPKCNETILDTCAAPGNKTSHLASLMNNEGKLIAVEKDKQRFATLKNQMKKLGIANAELINNDFLEIKVEDIPGVDGILVDPTCSGSGIHDLYEKDDDRIQKLKNFQAMMLKHAMSFGAKRIVYSTCSIHKEEGEDVVNECIIDSEYQICDIAQIFRPLLLDNYEVCDKFVRCKNEANRQTNGFFAAMLIKK